MGDGCRQGACWAPRRDRAEGPGAALPLSAAPGRRQPRGLSPTMTHPCPACTPTRLATLSKNPASNLGTARHPLHRPEKVAALTPARPEPPTTPVPSRDLCPDTAPPAQPTAPPLVSLSPSSLTTLTHVTCPTVTGASGGLCFWDGRGTGSLQACHSTASPLRGWPADHRPRPSGRATQSHMHTRAGFPEHFSRDTPLTPEPRTQDGPNQTQEAARLPRAGKGREQAGSMAPGGQVAGSWACPMPTAPGPLAQVLRGGV